jgi:hypothetical protein
LDNIDFRPVVTIGFWQFRQANLGRLHGQGLAEIIPDHRPNDLIGLSAISHCGKRKAQREKSSSYPHFSGAPVSPSSVDQRRGWIMTEVSIVPAEVVDFREEARGCVQLAKAEKHDAVRTVFLGMALGYLRLDDRAKSAGAIELQAEDIRPHHG